MAWLYRYETKGIQRWILDSNLMRDLAGGSALVESLSQKAAALAEENGGEILQSTSGAMTATFSEYDGLSAFASEWPMEVALTAPGLQMVQSWVDADAELKGLFEKLTGQRNRVFVQDLEAGPWVLRCGRSGQPALVTPSRFEKLDARKTAMDAPSIAKETARSQARRESGAVTGGLEWDRFAEDPDLWDGPVGVVHADGSGVGQRLMELGADKLKQFSADLREATREATRKALEALPREGSKLLARPIVSAGDDLTCIVPARHARIFAETWLMALEEETAARSGLNGKIYAGAGIAIVHSGFPFARANEIAEALCSAAKKAVDKQCSVLAFRRVTASLLEEETAGALGWRVGGESKLTPLVQAVADLPRGTLRTWLGLFERNDSRAAQLWRRAEEVADKECWGRFQAALREAGGEASGAFHKGSGASVLLKDGDRATPVKDALTMSHIEKPGR